MEITMKILLMTSSDHPDYSADCDCAVLEVTPKLIKRIRHRIEIAEQAAAGDGKLWELRFLGCGLDYYKYDLAETCADVAERTRDLGLQGWFGKFESEGLQPIPETIDLELFEPRRTECDHEIIRRSTLEDEEAEISWKTRPKHSDICITTWPVTLQQLDTLVQPECVSASHHG